jgi:DNA-nicking Smr family endonuclease
MKKKPTKGEPKKKAPDTAFRPFTALKAIRDEMQAEPTKAPPPKPKATIAVADLEDEGLSLHRLMSGVTPLAGKATRIPKSQDRLPTSDLHAKRAQSSDPVREENEAVHAHLRALVEGGRFEVQDDGTRVQGHRHGITAAVVRKLRQGLFPIDARIDLHGKTAAQAQNAVEEFLAAQHARGERCVLVVHGKGEHSPGRVGVLRGEIAAWLSQGSASAHVGAFATAHDEDGGEGAVYVLLTRPAR